MENTVATGGDGKARIGDGLATGREQLSGPEVAKKWRCEKRVSRKNFSTGVSEAVVDDGQRGGK